MQDKKRPRALPPEGWKGENKALKKRQVQRGLLLNRKCLFVNRECLLVNLECLLVNRECLLVNHECLLVNRECLLLVVCG